MTQHKILKEDLITVSKYKLPYEKIKGRKVLVTGGGGFVGAWLAASLCRVGAEVAVTMRDPIAGDKSAVFPFGDVKEYAAPGSFIGHAIADFEPDVVIHAASPGDPGSYLSDPVGTLECNFLQMNQILAHALKSKPTVMLISSGEVYGGVWNAKGVTENNFGPLDPLHPRSCYAEGKRAAEALCLAYNRQYGVPVRIARLHHSYGPGMRLARDTRALPTFFREVLAGRKPTVTTPNFERTWLYASDMATGLLTVLLEGGNEAYNVGEITPHSILSIAKMLSGEVIMEPPTPDESVSPHSHIQPDCSKLMKLGWFPNVPVTSGLQRTMEFYRDQ